MNRTTTTVAIGGVVIALVALIAFLFSRGNIELLTPVFLNVTQESEAEDEQIQTPTTTVDTNVGTQANTSASGNISSVPSSAPTNMVYLGEVESGNVVIVPSATLSRPGYIVLYRVKSTGESTITGNSSLLSAGTHTNVRIQLDQFLIDKQGLVATLHEDDGDQEFEYPESDGYLTNNGTLVNDIDVVGIKSDYQESRTLEQQVEAYVENNF